jgi:hypothetical protein
MESKHNQCGAANRRPAFAMGRFGELLNAIVALGASLCSVAAGSLVLPNPRLKADVENARATRFLPHRLAA